MPLIYILRHAQSKANVGEQMIDAPLTEFGKKQASKVNGHFDLVICSVMTRTKETLEYSKITYNNLIYSRDCREMKMHIGDFLPGEPSNKHETTGELMRRLDNFTEFVKEKAREHKKILVVSHWNTLMHWTSTNRTDILMHTDFPNGIDMGNAELNSFNLR